MQIKDFPIAVSGSAGQAHLTAYIIDNDPSLFIKKRPLVLICPGGGYRFVSAREAEVFALQFTAMGYHAAVLTYSVSPAVYPTQLLEMGAAWKLLRKYAGEWNILTNKIVVLGCSAGGHLAASYSVFHGEDFLTRATGLTEEELRPAGMILCYPVITSGEHAHRDSFAALLGCTDETLQASPLLEKVSLEKQVNAQTPPAFLWHTFTDDLVPVENSLLFATALRAENINTELHIFPEGGHGLGLANTFSLDSNGWGIQEQCQQWLPLAQTWLRLKVGLGEA